MNYSIKSIFQYLKLSLIFFIFHFFTWNILSNFFDSFLSFLLQFAIFSTVYIYLNKKFDYIVFLFPALLLYFITVIAFLDRSITVNLMTYYAQEETIFLNNLLNLEQFATENIIQKRIDEQISSGLLIKKDSYFELSDIGRFVSEIYIFLKEFYY